jgi:hypothetical protein
MHNIYQLSHPRIEQNHQSSFAAVGLLKGFVFAAFKSISLTPFVSLLTLDETAAGILSMEVTAEPSAAPGGRALLVSRAVKTP